MQWRVAMIVLAALAASLPGPGALADVAPAEKAGYPFEGEVNAGRVRVRAGGNINERELTVLSKGDRVTVLEEQFGWYRIACPPGCKAWVSAKFAAESPGAPQSITLTADDIQLRAADSPNASSMGSFPKGSVFAVSKRRGDWYEVQCPPEASAWVNAKYVSPLGGAAPPVPPGPGPGREQPAGDALSKEWARLEAAHDAMMGRPFEEMDLDGLIAGYQALGAQAAGTPLADRCKARVEELGGRRSVRDEIRSGISQAQAELQRKLDAINAQYEARIAQILREHRAQRSPSDFTETGWLSGIGRMLACPATHRLKKGERHLSYLRSDKDAGGRPMIDLERYRNQYVGVIGERLHDPGWGDLIIVKDIQVLGESAQP